MRDIAVLLFTKIIWCGISRGSPSNSLVCLWISWSNSPTAPSGIEESMQDFRSIPFAAFSVVLTVSNCEAMCLCISRPVNFVWSFTCCNAFEASGPNDLVFLSDFVFERNKTTAPNSIVSFLWRGHERYSLTNGSASSILSNVSWRRNALGSRACIFFVPTVTWKTCHNETAIMSPVVAASQMYLSTCWRLMVLIPQWGLSLLEYYEN